MAAAVEQQAVAEQVAQPIAIPIKKVLPWTMLAAFVFAFGVFFVGTEQGAASVTQGNAIHEFFHDARHMLGFPCH